MKKIFSKKTVAITAVTIFMVSLFAWGITGGNEVLTGSGETDTSIEVASLFSLTVDPDAIVFDRQVDVGGNHYDSSDPDPDPAEAYIEGGDENIFANVTVDVIVESPGNYNVRIESTEMINTDDPGYDDEAVTFDDHNPEWTTIPADNIHCSDADVGLYLPANGDDFFTGDDTSSEQDGSRTHLADFQVTEVPDLVFDGSHVGQLTFDLNAL